MHNLLVSQSKEVQQQLTGAIFGLILIESKQRYGVHCACVKGNEVRHGMQKSCGVDSIIVFREIQKDTEVSGIKAEFVNEDDPTHILGK